MKSKKKKYTNLKGTYSNIQQARAVAFLSRDDPTVKMLFSSTSFLLRFFLAGLGGDALGGEGDGGTGSKGSSPSVCSSGTVEVYSRN
jgi:hypothetical protein